MENSFFEYRDKTGVDSGDSDSEIIDNSLLGDSLSTKKSALKNQTVFVAESEESSTGELDNEDLNESKDISSTNVTGVVKRSSAAESHLIISSDDDSSKRGSIRRQSDTSQKKVVYSSSDEDTDEGSPELVPRKNLRIKYKERRNESKSNSLTGRLKSRKRMILVDSDTENSIVIDHDKNRKLTCLKDTPLKIDGGKKVIKYSDEEMNKKTDVESDEDNVADKCSVPDKSNDDSNEDSTAKGKVRSSNEDQESGEYVGSDDSDDDGPDEDEMLMSRATRMSIMGVIPKGSDSEESDCIQSDESKQNSQRGSMNSLNDLPDVSTCIYKSPPKQIESDKDTSNITCSPFSSPLRDITNEQNESKHRPELPLRSQESRKRDDRNDSVIDLDFKEKESQNLRSKVLNNLKVNNSGHVDDDDDDVTIIDSKQEIIALSSDDDDVVVEQKSTKPKTKVKDEITTGGSRDNTIKKFLVPTSYPNQVVYVQKHVRENELNKLNGLREDLHNVRNLLDNMDLSTLPDRGVRLIERLTGLEAAVRKQGDIVANMVVEPDAPTAAHIAQDGFDKKLSWDDIQKASNSVAPRMFFGKPAMSSHLAERNLILDRLRDLHESLASMPPESQLAAAPRGLRAQLMPHQLHALAWLRWRETQRPCGGILADDMGLGKTLTMISLMLGDKEGNIEDEEDDDDQPSKGKSKVVRGGTLVVCPASLLQQWGGEVARHAAPHALLVTLHHGAARAAHPHRLAVADLVVTTYHILLRDHEKNGVLMRVRWRRVVLDEAHAVRNHKSATCAAACAVPARRRWALTGTPVQNRDLDVFALARFLRLTPFDELQMWKKWIDNKSQGGQERLNTIMRCVLLRRTKVQLQEKGQLEDLPQKTEILKTVTLSKNELNVYQKVLVLSKNLFAKYLHQRAEKQADADGFQAPERDTAYAQVHKKMVALLQGAKPVKAHEILVLLLRLRQVCCHCGLIGAMLDGADGADEDAGAQDLMAELNKLSLEESRQKTTNDREETENQEEEGTTVAEAIKSVLSANNPAFDLSRPSAKIAAVMDCLQKDVLSNPGEKAVVVSQWTSVLALVERELARLAVPCVTLSGRVPVPARPAAVAALNEPRGPVRVMLLSLCAGGVGLNLCGANHLLLLDPHWNPQLERQAADRVYRMGQTRPVRVYRFICVDTVEQSIDKLQQRKLDIADSVLTGARHTNRSNLSIEDLKMLFNMGTAAGGPSQGQVAGVGGR